MLEKPLALEVMLAHGSGQFVDRRGDLGEGVAGSPDGHVEGFFVPVDVVVEEVGAIVVPKAELEGIPAAEFVDGELAGFELAFGGGFDAAELPNGA